MLMSHVIPDRDCIVCTFEVRGFQLYISARPGQKERSAQERHVLVTWGCMHQDMCGMHLTWLNKTCQHRGLNRHVRHCGRILLKFYVVRSDSFEGSHSVLIVLRMRSSNACGRGCIVAWRYAMGGHMLWCQGCHSGVY